MTQAILANFFPKRRQRGEINWVVVSLIIVLGGGGYAIMTFLPPWYKSLQAKELMGEYLSGTSLEALDEDQFRESLVNELKKIKVDVSPTDLRLEIDRENKRATGYLHWKAIIRFPFSKKTKIMHFKVKSSKRTGI